MFSSFKYQRWIQEAAEHLQVSRWGSWNQMFPPLSLLTELQEPFQIVCSLLLSRRLNGFPPVAMVTGSSEHLGNLCLMLPQSVWWWRTSQTHPILLLILRLPEEEDVWSPGLPEGHPALPTGPRQIPGVGHADRERRQGRSSSRSLPVVLTLKPGFLPISPLRSQTSGTWEA